MSRHSDPSPSPSPSLNPNPNLNPVWLEFTPRRPVQCQRRKQLARHQSALGFVLCSVRLLAAAAWAIVAIRGQQTAQTALIFRYSRACHSSRRVVELDSNVTKPKLTDNATGATVRQRLLYFMLVPTTSNQQPSQANASQPKSTQCNPTQPDNQTSKASQRANQIHLRLVLLAI